MCMLLLFFRIQIKAYDEHSGLEKITYIMWDTDLDVGTKTKIVEQTIDAHTMNRVNVKIVVK